MNWLPVFISIGLTVMGFGLAQPKAADYLRASAEVDTAMATFYIENISDCLLESVQVRIAHNSVYFTSDERSLYVALEPGQTGTFVTQLSQVVNADWQWALDSVTLADCSDAGVVTFEHYDFGKPASVEAGAAVPNNVAPVTGRLVYTIQKGDTVFIIAEKYGITARELMDANGLASEALIFGHTLTIPLSLLGDGGTLRNYVVAQGDTLFQISQRFGIGLELIQKLNCLGDESLVKLGQSLQIPPDGTTDVVRTCF
ncbi:MAG: LysM peptidoglycan-binding domain-containing protein [Trueperaceae bacterium]|nr:LysM peptidoglycan-binding domain-containing protein [Trueperaceae bacterium]